MHYENANKFDEVKVLIFLSHFERKNLIYKHAKY